MHSFVKGSTQCLELDIIAVELTKHENFHAYAFWWARHDIRDKDGSSS